MSQIIQNLNLWVLNSVPYPGKKFTVKNSKTTVKDDGYSNRAVSIVLLSAAIFSQHLSTSSTSSGLNRPRCQPSISKALSRPAAGLSPKAIFSNSCRTLSSHESACMRRLASFSTSSSIILAATLGVS